MIQANSTFRQRIAVLRWAAPLSFVLLGLAFEFGPSRWVQANYGDVWHVVADILFYVTVGPLLTLWALKRIGSWPDEMERAQKQAQASERQLAAITAASADAIVGLDPEGRINFWNDGAEFLFGYTALEMQARPLADLLGDSPAARVELQWLLETVRRAGFLRGHETTCLDADGRRVAVELMATLLRGEANEPAGMSIIVRDITRRREREAEIRRLNASLNEQVAARTRELSEKLQELARANAELQKLDQTRSELVSLVSHQVRAPLANMRGAMERMQPTCGLVSPTCGRMLEIMNQQIERLDRLVRDVLSAMRLESGELVFHPEPFSVLPLVEQVIEQTRARTGDRPIRLPTKPGLPLAFADRDRVADVLANLLDNADKYSPSAETVTIEARADQDEITLAVRDAGPGVPAGDLAHIFDKFQRVDSSDSQAAYGYGLGLYVCRRLVEAQGGRIWAENHPRGGAVFSFTLPVAR